MRRLLRDRWASAGAATVLAFLTAAGLAPWLAALGGHDPYTYDLDALDTSGMPVGWGGGIGADHWLGVEPLTGRDLFAIAVHGARTSLLIGVSATAVAVVIGVGVGTTAGYFGGWTDRVISRVIDVLFGFPALIFMIALGAIAPASVPRQLLVIGVIGLFGWPGIARVVRAQTLSLRHRTFVVASVSMGAGPWHVLTRQILPNLTSTIIVYSTIMIPGMIGVQAALSFLGVGLPPPTPDWGALISNAIDWVQTDPMYLAVPGTALFLATLGFNLLGDGLRDILDPRLGAGRARRPLGARR
ncbi:peptide/nickel transport system permease protein [Allocatelliglobosispora scoriae]|uniref:Peptide/nickel transport system permease protein n=1 Tax=Allocatelliglobosispora scoriae TaxID=643052 RepID=A0A841C316_9ACTN|nr:ABC transporter permease [Allocatelliglobosispora scoriae]MBB5873699.1 peptide/nickel transport system permease protein [Allocatelliglobosispora scoriae]